MNPQQFPNLKITLPIKKKIPKVKEYETDVTIDNILGGEDLYDLTLYYVKFQSTETATQLIAKSVKKGKKVEFKLKKGSNPAAFFLLWKNKGADFFRWIGDGEPVNGVNISIKGNFRVDEIDGIRIWSGGTENFVEKP